MISNYIFTSVKTILCKSNGYCFKINDLNMTNYHIQLKSKTIYIIISKYLNCNI